MCPYSTAEDHSWSGKKSLCSSPATFIFNGKEIGSGISTETDWAIWVLGGSASSFMPMIYRI